MSRSGGPIIPVKVVTDAELAGGQYTLAGGPARRLYGLSVADGPVEGGPALPVYVVSAAQVASGQFAVEGGIAIPAIDYLSVGAGRVVLGGPAMPVYDETGALSGGGAAAPSAPAAPTGLSAAYSSGSQVDLAWTDNATDETGYKIYRSTDGVIYAEIDDIAVDSTSYSDTTVTPGTLYYYKVAAYNAGGESFSNVDTAQPYWQKVLNTQAANLIGLWRLNETSGATADDSSPEVNDGAYQGTIQLANAAGPDGVPVPLFSGDDRVDIYSAGFDADFNGAEGTFAAWIKVVNAGVWADGAFRHVVNISTAITITDGIEIFKTSAANTLQFAREGANVREQINVTISDTDWIHIALTWSEAADQVKVYIDGLQSGTTQTTLGVYSGAALNANNVSIGAKTQTFNNPWSGWIALPAVWTVPLSPAEVAALADPLA